MDLYAICLYLQKHFISEKLFYYGCFTFPDGGMFEPELPNEQQMYNYVQDKPCVNFESLLLDSAATKVNN